MKAITKKARAITKEGSAQIKGSAPQTPITNFFQAR
jgi:hypothetical protein